MINTEFKRLFRISLRQPIEFFLGIILLTLIFLGIRTAIPAMSGVKMSTNADQNFILGYFAWVIVNNVVSFVYGELNKDIKSGVFEIFFIRRHALEKIIIARSLYAAIHSFALALCLWFVWLLIVQSELSMFSPEFIGLVILSIAWGLPLGLLSASLSIVSRQTGALIVLLHLVIATLLFLPALLPAKSSLGYFLPVSSLVEFIQSPTWTPFISSLLSFLAWLALSILTWRAAKKIAVLRGSIDPNAYL
jgi:hypothetical protein